MFRTGFVQTVQRVKVNRFSGKQRGFYEFTATEQNNFRRSYHARFIEPHLITSKVRECVKPRRSENLENSLRHKAFPPAKPLKLPWLPRQRTERSDGVAGLPAGLETAMENSPWSGLIRSGFIADSAKRKRHDFYENRVSRIRRECL